MTLNSRVQKKLTERESWYRESKKRERDEEDPDEHLSRRKRQKTDEHKPADGAKDNNTNNKVKAPMFIPYTVGSGLAKQLKEAENKMGDLTGRRIRRKTTAQEDDSTGRRHHISYI